MAIIMPPMPESKRGVFEYRFPPAGYRLKPVPHIDHPPQAGWPRRNR